MGKQRGEGRSDLALMAIMAALFAALLLKAAALGLPEVRAGGGPEDFDTGRAIERLARILGDERPHPVDSEANDAVRERLIAEIEALGYAPEVRDDFSCLPRWGRVLCARVRNVVFRSGPEGGGAVMVASHYDSVPAGPGAADDGIGVAVSLELASLIAAAPPERPVVFLITDGEEAGLLGAASFVRNDPWAKDIAAAINLEARGVRGPAQMFETSMPNARDIDALAAGASRPFSNSMMTDIYRLLPNDTDVSMFLPEGYDILNFALTEGDAFYHTPLDNLAALDPKSVQHMGDQALGALKAFLAQEAAGEEGTVIFADILSRVFVVLPHWLGPAAIGLALLLSAVSFFRAGGPRPIRAALTAPATLILAAVLAFGLQAMIGALRPEAAYWRAFPVAMQSLAYLSAIVGALAALSLIGAGAGRMRLIHAAWFWFAVLGAMASMAAPGASVLFSIPLAFYVTGALAGFAMAHLRLSFAVLAAGVAIIVIAPEIHFSEIGLGFDTAFLFSALAALLVMTTAPLAVGRENRSGLAPLGLAAIGLAFAAGAALVVPAYSETAPRPLSLQYFFDADTREAAWLIGGARGPAPATMQAVAPFAPRAVEGLSDGRQAASAPILEMRAPEIMVLADERVDEERRVRFLLVANGADQLTLRLPAAARARAVMENGREHVFEGDGASLLTCSGRACDGAVFTLALAETAPVEWMLFGWRYGLPAAAEPLLDARPGWAVPIQSGDVTIVRVRKSV